LSDEISRFQFALGAVKSEWSEEDSTELDEETAPSGAKDLIRQQSHQAKHLAQTASVVDPIIGFVASHVVKLAKSEDPQAETTGWHGERMVQLARSCDDGIADVYSSESETEILIFKRNHD
jgi:hypothetical protein